LIDSFFLFTSIFLFNPNNFAPLFSFLFSFSFFAKEKRKEKLELSATIGQPGTTAILERTQQRCCGSGPEKMRRHCGPLFLLGLVVVATLLGLAQASASGNVTLEFGKSIDPAVQTRISALLRPFLASSGTLLPLVFAL
jgi:hypothetical protein